jgi:CheY-like chemotaxis protein
MVRKVGPPSPPVPVPSRKGRILVVDDERIQVEAMTSLLERLGHEVLSETDPRTALLVFRQDPQAFDLVITDQNMPLLRGERLAASILRLRQDIPIILCTGCIEMVDIEKAKALGIREFLLKPLSLQGVADSVRRALGS